MLSEEQIKIVREVVEELEPNSEDKDVTVLSLSLILGKEGSIEEEVLLYKSLFNALGDKEIDEDFERWNSLLKLCKEKLNL